MGRFKESIMVFLRPLLCDRSPCSFLYALPSISRRAWNGLAEIIRRHEAFAFRSFVTVD